MRDRQYQWDGNKLYTDEQNSSPEIRKDSLISLVIVKYF